MRLNANLFQEYETIISIFFYTIKRQNIVRFRIYVFHQNLHLPYLLDLCVLFNTKLTISLHLYPKKKKRRKTISLHSITGGIPTDFINQQGHLNKI